MKRPLNQGISHDPLENANILNRHFASIGNRLASDLPSSDKSFCDYLPLNVPSCSFVFDSVLPSEIELEIMLTPSKKSYGLYSWPTRLLKCSRHIISALWQILLTTRFKGVFSPPNLSMLRLSQYLRMGTKPNPGTIVLYHFFRFLIDSLRKLCTTA